MKKISFDFDNTIAMGFMTYIKEKPVPVFQSYNDKIIKKINNTLTNPLFYVILIIHNKKTI